MCYKAHAIYRAGLKDQMKEMNDMWQFPFCWTAIDGCHIPIKCPPGGVAPCKEYHNFKNCDSVVLMAMVDLRYRFIWGSCGFPANSHDAIIFRLRSLGKVKRTEFSPRYWTVECSFKDEWEWTDSSEDNNPCESCFAWCLHWKRRHHLQQARFNKRSVVSKRGITSLHRGFRTADQNFNIHDQILKLQLTNMYATWLFKVPLWDMYYVTYLP